jgi:hypothetical protein
MLQWLLHDFQPYISTKQVHVKTTKQLSNEKKNRRVMKTRKEGYGKRQVEIEKVFV